MVRRLSSPSGFSLIELVVVILIVGLLATVMIPRFLGQRDSSNDAAARSNLRNAVSSVAAYYLQNGESYPASTDSSGLNDLADFVCTSESGLSVAGRCGALAGSTSGPPTSVESCSGSGCLPGSAANPAVLFLSTGASAGKNNWAKLCNVSRGARIFCVRLNGGGSATWASATSSMSAAADIAASGNNYAAAVLATSGLSAYWRLNEPSGASTFSDSRGGLSATRAASGVTAGVASPRPGGSSGVQLTSPSAAANQGFLTLPASSAIWPSPPCTYEAWVNLDTLNAVGLRSPLFASRNWGTGAGFNWWISDTGWTQMATFNGPGVSAYPGASMGMAAGVSYHVAMVLTSSTSVSFYLNGMLKGTVSSGFSYLPNTAASISVGAEGTSYQATMRVSDLAIYSRALSASELLSHYQAGQ